MTVYSVLLFIKNIYVQLFNFSSLFIIVLLIFFLIYAIDVKNSILLFAIKS